MKTFLTLLDQHDCQRAVGMVLSAAAIAIAVPSPATAQTALDSASVSVNADSPTTQSNLRIVKIAKDSGFALTITNVGSELITGAIAKDTIGKGLPCPVENAVTFTGSGTPLGSFTLAVLISSGIKLGALSNGQSVTLFYSCDAS